MDPKLAAAMPAIIDALRRGGQMAAAAELERFVQSGGSMQISGSTVALAEPIARQHGVSVMPEVRQRAPGGVKPSQPTGPNDPENPAPGAAQQPTVPASAPGTTAIPTPPQVPQIPRTPSIADLQPHDNQGAGQVPGIGGTGSGPGGAMTTPPKTEVPTGAPNAGNFGAFQGDYLSRDDEMLKRFAMQQAGFNPDIMSRGTKIAQGALSPIMQALRAAYGANDPTKSTQGLPDFLAQAAKGYTDKGNDFYGGLRNYAQGVLGGGQFGDFLGGISDQDEKFQMLQTLVPLLYGGANPMIQQSVGDQLGALFGKFHDDEFYGGKPNTLADFLGRSQSTLSPALQQLFGPLLKK